MDEDVREQGSRSGLVIGMRKTAAPSTATMNPSRSRVEGSIGRRRDRRARQGLLLRLLQGARGLLVEAGGVFEVWAEHLRRRRAAPRRAGCWPRRPVWRWRPFRRQTRHRPRRSPWRAAVREHRRWIAARIMTSGSRTRSAVPMIVETKLMAHSLLRREWEEAGGSRCGGGATRRRPGRLPPSSIGERAREPGRRQRLDLQNGHALSRRFG
jgi:hypothetical protein